MMGATNLKPDGFFHLWGFRRRREPVAFVQREGCLVMPTTVLLARKWAQGSVGDLELIFQTDTLTPTGEAILALSLYGRRAVFSFVRQVLSWPGARAGAFRTSNSSVEGWGKRFGFEIFHKEPAGQFRLYGDAEALEKFRAHFHYKIRE